MQLLHTIGTRIYWRWVVGSLIATLLSVCTYVLPQTQPVIVGALLLGFILLCLRRIEWGVLIIFAELLLGVYGYLFTFSFGSVEISLRMLLFISWLTVWFVRFVQSPAIRAQLTRYRLELLGLGYVIGYGIVVGLLQQRELSLIFFDMNGWLFWLYAIPFMLTPVSYQHLVTMCWGVMTWMGVQTVVVLFVFAHQFTFLQELLYRWLRDYRLMEITPLNEVWYRIFSQGQIFVLFTLAAVTVTFLVTKQVTHTKRLLVFFAMILMLFLLSYSRSFWLGAALGVIVWLAWVGWLYRQRIIQLRLHIIRVIAYTSVAIFGAILIVLVVIHIPVGTVGQGSLSESVTNRFAANEAAASARLLLLGPLTDAVKQSWMFGQGFGATVTYYTSDPRIVAITPGGSGEYTTYAFEWGYLDMLLKFGIVGLLVYMAVLWRFAQRIYQATIHRNQPVLLILSLAASMIVVTHITTPYLNHPLGIGYCILLLVLAINSPVYE